MTRAASLFIGLLGAPLLMWGQANSPQRLAQWAQLPDWSGQWEMGRPPGGAPPPSVPAQAASGGKLPSRGPGMDVPIPFNAEWESRYEAYGQTLASLSDSDAAPDTTVTECVWGFPRMELGPAIFEINVTPEETMIDFDPRETRHIYTDGRKHPEHLTPTAMGHSIGHWEGQTLLVDTVGLRDDIWVNAAGAHLSRSAHAVERWSQLPNGRLQDEIVIDDPLAFKSGSTWKMTRTFGHVTDTNRIVVQNCMENSHDLIDGSGVTTIFKPGLEKGK